MEAIIVLGPPGSGKGTQSKILSNKLKYPHISAGDLLREETKKQSEIGKEVDKIISKGNLVPDELIFEVVKNKIDELKKEKGIIIDGFPRTKVQAQLIEENKKKMNIDKIYVINLELGEDKIIDRLIKRKEKENRKDDNEEVIKNRIKVYMEKSFPAIEYLKEKEPVVDIDGSGTIEEVEKEIEKKLFI